MITQYNLLKIIFVLLVVQCSSGFYSLEAQRYFGHDAISTAAGTSNPLGVYPVPDPESGDQEIVVRKREIGIHFDGGNDYILGSTPWSSSLTLEIHALDGNGSTVQTQSVEFVLDGSQPEGHLYLDYTPIWRQVETFEIIVVGYTASSPLIYQPFRLEIEHKDEIGFGLKEDDGATDIKVDLAQMEVEPCGTIGAEISCATFKWSLSGGQYFKSFDLEIFKGEPDGDGNIEIDWRKATTIEVDGTEYTMSLTEGTGVYYWRVRPLGDFYPNLREDYRNYGQWSTHPATGTLLTGVFVPVITPPSPVVGIDFSTPPSGYGDLNSGSTVSGSDRFFYRQFDDNLNWIYGKVLTEGSRQSEQISYADGLNIVRQQQTKLYSQNYVMATQTVPDYSARPALQSLPAPVRDESAPYLKFEPNFFQRTGGNTVSSADYDESNIYSGANLAAPTANGLNPNSYYSNSNTALGKYANYVPDAGGVPYVRTLFYNDATGRVYRQAAPGATMSLDDGPDSRNVITLYGSVSKLEIDRMFGEEAPKAGTIFKTITIDPNGVASVTYSGKSGQVLATCLENGSEVVPSMMEVADEADPVNSFTVTHEFEPGFIDESGWENYAYESFVILASDEIPGIGLDKSKQVDIYYEMDPKSFGIPCEDICQECDYEISLELSCPLFPAETLKNATATKIVGGADLYNSSTGQCSPLTLGQQTLPGSGWTLTVPGGGTVPPNLSGFSGGTIYLPTGSYILRKSIKVNRSHPGSPLGTTYLDTAKIKLIEGAEGWSASDNCCGPIVIDPPYDCPYEPKGCGGTPDPDTLAHYMYDQLLEENSTTYIAALNAEPSSMTSGVSMSEGDFSDWLDDRLNYGIGCEELWECFQVHYNLLIANQERFDAGLPAVTWGPTNSLPFPQPQNGYAADFDLLANVDACVGYDPNDDCFNVTSIEVDYGTASVLPHSYSSNVLKLEIPAPSGSPTPSNAGEAQRNLYCVQAFFNYTPPSSYSGWTQIPNGTERPGYTYEEAAREVCNCVSELTFGTPPANSATATELLYETEDACRTKCEEKALAYEAAIDGYVLDYNLNLATPAYDPLDPGWTSASSLFNADKACLVEAMLADCRSKCDLTIHRLVADNPSLISSNQAGLTTEQENLDFVMNGGAYSVTPFGGPPPTPGSGGYPTTNLSAAQQDIIDFVNQSIADEFNGIVAAGSPTYTSYFQTALSGVDVFFQTGVFLFPETGGADAQEIEVQTAVLKDASDPYEILEINIGMFCESNSTNPHITWSYKPGTGCVYFRGIPAGTFATSMMLSNFYFDSYGAFHSVLADNLCNGTVQSLNTCETPGIGTFEIDVTGGTTGNYISIQAENTVTSQLMYITGVPVQIQGTAQATADAIVSEINAFTGTSGFAATNLNSSGTPITTVTVNMPDNIGGIITDWTLIIPSDLLFTSPDPNFVACSSPLQDIIVGSGCPRFAINSELNCPVGYEEAEHLTTWTDDFSTPGGGGSYGAGYERVANRLEGWWEYTIAKGFDGPYNVTPLYPISNLPPTSNNQYFEETFEFYLNDGSNAYKMRAYAGVVYNQPAEEIRGIYFGLNGFDRCNASPEIEIASFFLSSCIQVSGGSYACQELYPSVDPTNLPGFFTTKGSLLDIEFDLASAFIDVELQSGSNYLSVGSEGVWVNGVTVSGPDDFVTNLDGFLKNSNKCSSPTVDCQICLQKASPTTPSTFPITPEDPCEAENEAFIANQVATLLSQCKEEQLDKLEDNYKENCLYGIEDELSISYELNYHQYTLYYYDRANNLIRTVPPAGFVPHNSSDVFKHEMHTEYMYNSIGQLVKQITPDGGETKFWYNALGQLVLSQDAEQAVQGLYSYTRYDNLGRIVETGELVGYTPNYSGTAPANSLNILEIWQERDFPDNVVNGTTITTREVMSTTYSQKFADAECSGMTQTHTRNRITRVQRDADGNGVPESRTFFSYDPHGNVEWCVQYLPEIGKKTIRYEYDLVSGNVLQVIYNEDGPDQFMHEYAYDEDNRITEVRTSRDGRVWETEAQYEYYLHGPLARAVIGEDKVQGNDYVYSIEGYLKSINQSELVTELDPGKDGDLAQANGGFTISPGDASGNVEVFVDGVSVGGYTILTPTSPATIAANIAANIAGGYSGSSDGAEVTITPSGGNGYHVVEIRGSIPVYNVKHIYAGVQDEFAMELGYYDGDYTRTGSAIGNDPGNVHNPYLTSGLNLTPEDYDLFNGNISWWATNTRSGQSEGAGIKPLMGKVNLYHYDKLNRIRSADMWERDVTNPVKLWTTNRGSYRERFTFDRNGNILTATRAGHNGHVGGTIGTTISALGDPGTDYIIDTLNYEYGSSLAYGLGHTATASGVTNRLDRVVENALNPADPTWGQWADDLGDQTANNKNYEYDAEGKLVLDKSEGLEIEWNILNKVKKVTKRDPITQDLQRIIEFEYDAMGVRVLKRVQNYNGSGVLVNQESTIYASDPQGNTMAIYGSDYVPGEATVRLRELPIYGSDRLGLHMAEEELYSVYAAGAPGSQSLISPATRGALSKIFVPTAAAVQPVNTGNNAGLVVESPLISTGNGYHNTAILTDGSGNIVLGAAAVETSTNVFQWQFFESTGSAILTPQASAEIGIWAKPVLIADPAGPNMYYFVYYPQGTGFRNHKVIHLDLSGGPVISSPVDLTPGTTMGGSIALETFSAGGHRLFTYSRSGDGSGYEIWAIDITGTGISDPILMGRVEAFFGGWNLHRNVLALSPDGNTLAMALRRGDFPNTGMAWELVTWPLEGNCAKTAGDPSGYLLSGGTTTGLSFSPCGDYVYYAYNNGLSESKIGRLNLNTANNATGLQTFASTETDVCQTPTDYIVAYHTDNIAQPFTVINNPSIAASSNLNFSTPFLVLGTTPRAGIPVQRVLKPGAPMRGDRLAELRHWLAPTGGGTVTGGVTEMDFDPAPVSTNDPYGFNFAAGQNVAVGEDRDGTPMLRMFLTDNAGVETTILADATGWPITGGVGTASSTAGIMADRNGESLILKNPGLNENWTIITARNGKLWYHLAEMDPVIASSGTLVQKNNIVKYLDNNGLEQSLSYDLNKDQYAMAAFQNLSSDNGVKLFTAVNLGTSVEVYQHNITEDGIEPGVLIKTFTDAKCRSLTLIPGTSFTIKICTPLPTNKMLMDLGEMHISPDGNELSLALGTGGTQYGDGKIHHRLERFSIAEQQGEILAEYKDKREFVSENRPNGFSRPNQTFKVNTLTWDYSPAGDYAYRVGKAQPGTSGFFGTSVPRVDVQRTDRFSNGPLEAIWNTRVDAHKAALRRGFDDKMYLSAMTGTNTVINNTNKLTTWSTPDDATSSTVSGTRAQQSIGAAFNLVPGLPLQPYRVYDCVSGGGAVLAYRESDIRFYEMKDHLGNVRAIVSDLVDGVIPGGGNLVTQAIPTVKSWTDYYAFGYAMPGRKYQSADYRYGFNGKENDGELKGDGLFQDYGFRAYDQRLGRFFSVDPLTGEYPWNSVYCFAENDVVRSIDLDGLESVYHNANWGVDDESLEGTGILTIEEDGNLNWGHPDRKNDWEVDIVEVKGEKSLRNIVISKPYYSEKRIIVGLEVPSHFASGAPQPLSVNGSTTLTLMFEKMNEWAGYVNERGLSSNVPFNKVFNGGQMVHSTPGSRKIMEYTLAHLETLSAGQGGSNDFLTKINVTNFRITIPENGVNLLPMFPGEVRDEWDPNGRNAVFQFKLSRNITNAQFTYEHEIFLFTPSKDKSINDVINDFSSEFPNIHFRK